MTVKGLDRLRTLFAQEAEQRLARLGQLVLEMERSDVGALTEVIAEVFREVHTLKGSAAVVGLDGVAVYAHDVESKLSQLRSGSVTPNAPIVDALLVAVDRLESLIRESIEEREVDEAASSAAIAGLNEAFAQTAVPVVQAIAQAAPIGREASPVREAPATVMVPIDRLDELVRMVGEAAAAHLRVGRSCSTNKSVWRPPTSPSSWSSRDC